MCSVSEWGGIVANRWSCQGAGCAAQALFGIRGENNQALMFGVCAVRLFFVQLQDNADES